MSFQKTLGMRENYLCCDIHAQYFFQQSHIDGKCDGDNALPAHTHIGVTVLCRLIPWSASAHQLTLVSGCSSRKLQKNTARVDAFTCLGPEWRHATIKASWFLPVQHITWSNTKSDSNERVACNWPIGTILSKYTSYNTSLQITIPWLLLRRRNTNGRMRVGESYRSQKNGVFSCESA